jgi:sigma-B regulation protein RsbU (phosphoserine phosphatase)
LNALLEITQAINKNSRTTELIQMLETIMKSQLQIGRFRFLMEKNNVFNYISDYGGISETVDELNDAWAHLNKVQTPVSITGHKDTVLGNYDYFIPIHHKNRPLAFALVGDFGSSGELLNNDLTFIQTLINVIVVALENKRLFRERLEAERMQREMELAAEVQNMLIPLRIVKQPGVEVSSKYLPHQNIGGDYFDFFRLNENEFMWCIADVSGKGISAALLMANFQASLQGLANTEEDLTCIVERLNRIVINNTKGEKFITLFLAKYNQETRRLCYVNAGHNPTILYSGGEAIPLKLGTTMIGAFDELPFLNQGEVDIEPDSLLVNYTDGLMDYENHNFKLWSEEKLLDFVTQNGTMLPGEFNEKLMKHVNDLVKSKPIDDITLLTLKIS